MAVRNLYCWGGGGAVRGSEGHPANDDDLASEKGHLLAKRALFSTITGGTYIYCYPKHLNYLNSIKRPLHSFQNINMALE